MKKFLEKIYVLMIIYFFIELGIIVWNAGFNYRFFCEELDNIVQKYEKDHALDNVSDVYLLYKAMAKEDIPLLKIKDTLINFIKEKNSKSIMHYIFVLEVYNVNGGKNFAKMLLNPNVKYLQGKYLDSNYSDAKGHKFRVDMLKIVNSKAKKGFVSYYYIDPKNGKISKKTTALVYIPQLRWIVASGIYNTDIKNILHKYMWKIKKQTLGLIVFMIVLLFLIGLFIYFIYKNIISAASGEIEKEKKIFRYLTKLDKDLLQWNFNSSAFEKIKKLLNIQTFFIVNEKREAVYGDKPENCVCCEKVDFNKNYYFSDKEGDFCVIVIYHDLAAVFVCERKPLIHNLFILRHIAIQYISAIEKKLNEENLQEEIKKQIELLREKDLEIVQSAKMAAMGEMLGNITHQWKQPLNAMSNLINKMMLDMEFNEKIIKKEFLANLEKLQKIIFKLNGIINTFKNFYKNSSEKKDISLKEIFETVFLIFDDGSIKYRLNTDECRIKTYENDLEQVILNILSNARDQFKIKNIQNPEIRINVSCFEEYVIIEIEDNAGGIDENMLDKIFEKEYSTKGSTGLGLAMSRKIMQKLNGEIKVENAEKGAKFVIKIKRDD